MALPLTWACSDHPFAELPASAAHVLVDPETVREREPSEAGTWALQIAVISEQSLFADCPLLRSIVSRAMNCSPESSTTRKKPLA